jgi:DNA mismatch endonuclease (patch repair protein)
MRAVKSRGNKVTELALLHLLRRYKVTGWRRHAAVAGKSDFVFPKHRLAVFVDGCFWHGCPRHCRLPKGNRAYWNGKIAGNQARDRLVTSALRRAGWQVLRIWEHELTRKLEGRLARRIQQALA